MPWANGSFRRSNDPSFEFFVLPFKLIGSAQSLSMDSKTKRSIIIEPFDELA